MTLSANTNKLYEMGLGHGVRRSTLADANESRDWRIWSDVAALLIRRARKLYRDTELEGQDLKNTVYALNASTIDLCLSLFGWAQFLQAKAAVKLDTLLDLRSAIIAFIPLSDGKMHEINVLDLLPIDEGAYYVIGRNYLDFNRLYGLHQARGFIVTRTKVNLNARRIHSHLVDRAKGNICDQALLLIGFYATQHYPEKVRRIRCKNPDSCKTLIFLINSFVLPPLTIAALYKTHWQVELLFKCIKQHLRIKNFLDRSENAVKTQIWCAV